MPTGRIISPGQCCHLVSIFVRPASRMFCALSPTNIFLAGSFAAFFFVTGQGKGTRAALSNSFFRRTFLGLFFSIPALCRSFAFYPYPLPAVPVMVSGRKTFCQKAFFHGGNADRAPEVGGQGGLFCLFLGCRCLHRLPFGTGFRCLAWIALFRDFYIESPSGGRGLGMFYFRCFACWQNVV